jgi:hypothetical protein
VEPVKIIPDSWLLEPADTFIALEIEDRHPLTREKLWLYCDLFDTLDFYDLNLRLFVFDRYGHNQRELDLCAIYLDCLVEGARPSH